MPAARVRLLIVAIPDGVMLAAGDLDRRAPVSPTDPARYVRGDHLLPRPCEDAGYRGSTLRTGHRAAAASVDTRGDGLERDQVVHYVATFQDDGAPRLVADVRAALTCRGGTWIRVGEVGAGDEGRAVATARVVAARLGPIA
ncbi:hypothetical protein Val02_36760 [Virgisporangium aliadipatigenens]|uniref:Uncharacterized protein n=1 Tax=Virgisporangium aliadipatigenens TaxID=741659 RepID=A0A8J3YMS8_9ACTN|nr:hypothetical protein [Virgisporangium aliadipatigenens]GIJ46790.1 hypothetical protein Val02_36760 [Virgisporangium aliadipatigenens]